MTDVELAAWIRDLINRRAPESEMLDYKRTLDLSLPRARPELGKDVTSFANDRGGALLYGVPQDDSDSVPLPVPLDGCGISLAPNLAETVENILVETVDPALPELCIRVVSLAEAPGKDVLFVWHPLSWNRPHMTLYNERRYYRRGNFRAVIMREREVETAYASRRGAAEEAKRFLDGWVQRRPNPNEPAIHVTMCPHFAAVQPIDVLRPAFREWLFEQRPLEYGGSWTAFDAGWRFVPTFTPGYTRPLEVRLFNNGAVSCLDGIRQGGSSGTNRIVLSILADERLRRLFAFGSLIWGRLAINGPATSRIELTSVGGFTILPAVPWTGHESELPQDLSFDEETSIGEIGFSSIDVLARLLDRVAAAGGLWRA